MNWSPTLPILLVRVKAGLEEKLECAQVVFLTGVEDWRSSAAVFDFVRLDSNNLFILCNVYTSFYLRPALTLTRRIGRVGDRFKLQ